VVVAEEANFTRAAQRVHISQSGVSAQIRQLEHDLGVILIDRSGRTATLTAAGAAALPHARAVLASAGAVRQAVDAVTGLIRGRLMVGMVTACTVTPLFNALAGRPRVTLADISAYPIVCMPAGTGIRTVLDQACAAQGIRPDIALQASAPGAVADLAIRGLGIAILSESMAASYDTQLKTLVIDDIQTPAVLALIWTATESPALRELLRRCRQAFTAPQPAP
jgi:DNA-binding transcriptional LysR family regulator